MSRRHVGGVARLRSSACGGLSRIAHRHQRHRHRRLSRRRISAHRRLAASARHLSLVNRQRRRQRSARISLAQLAASRTRLGSAARRRSSSRRSRNVGASSHRGIWRRGVGARIIAWRQRSKSSSSALSWRSSAQPRRQLGWRRRHHRVSPRGGAHQRRAAAAAAAARRIARHQPLIGAAAASALSSSRHRRSAASAYLGISSKRGWRCSGLGSSAAHLAYNARRHQRLAAASAWRRRHRGSSGVTGRQRVSPHIGGAAAAHAAALGWRHRRRHRNLRRRIASA